MGVNSESLSMIARIFCHLLVRARSRSIPEFIRISLFYDCVFEISRRGHSMSLEDAELLKEFVVESQEHLADVENQLLTLESQGDGMDVALVNTVFRAVHSIKGAAGFLGLETLQGLAHREEEVLNKLRSQELRPTSQVINTLLKATDKLKCLLDAIDTSNDQDVSEHMLALEQILNGSTQVAEVKVEPTSASAGVAPHEPVENIQSNGISGEALREFLIESYDNLEQLERDLMSLERNVVTEGIINGAFRSIHTIKGTAGFLGYTKLERMTHAAENILGSVRSGQFGWDVEIGGGLFKVIDKARELLTAIEASGDEGDVNETELVGLLTGLYERKSAGAAPSAKKTKAKRTQTKKSGESAVKSKESSSAPRAQKNGEYTHQQECPNPADVTTVTPHPVAPTNSPNTQVTEAIVAAPATVQGPQEVISNARSATAPAADATSSAADSTIRVDVALLDKLMTCVGELVLARNQIIQFSNTHSDGELHRTTQRLNLITTELQEGVMKTRMQPIGNVWSKFPRLVRDLATICGKQVRIEMEGKETELDKTIIEAIKDPLTHLVRNTVDHGIEKPEVRLQKGKPVEGCLTLRAYHEGGQVNIEICDDGNGLNVERIRAKAIERNLITAEQAARMPDRDVGNLIFLPGFSTAETVSNVSGRGVGMDVVKTNIEKIGGTVDLQSQPGYGTTIKIKIPLTLAIIPALIVSSDNNRYAIPQVNLLELVRLDGEQVTQSVEWIHGAPVYRLRGRLLPLVYLRQQLKCTDLTGDTDALNIVVLRADDRQFGLVVDRINDTEEIVVKPLSKQLKGVPVYSGTTIMGDGKVALILDVLGLAHASNVISETRDRTMSELAERQQTRSADCQSLLVVGVGESHRYALPLSEVTRLEKIETSAIEISDHMQVVQYRGEILPLVSLCDAMGVRSSKEPTEDNLLDVVVYSECGRSVGLVVDRIIDIVDARLDITRPASRPGLLGSAVVGDHVTDLLDLPAVIRQVDPTMRELSHC